MNLVRLSIIGCLFLIALVAGAFFLFTPTEKNVARIQFAKTTVLAEVVQDPQARAQGLSGRNSIPKESGMLFIFDSPDYQGMWMKGMKFPIDIIWLSQDTVVDVESNVKPPRGTVPDISLPIYRPDMPSDFVLEVNSGFIEKHGIKIGDKVNITFGAKKHVPIEAIPVPGQEYYIETLKKKVFDGDNFKIDRLLFKNDAYQKFKISYTGGGLKLGGVMNIPLGELPKEGYPVLILNHGLIAPEVYTLGRGSRREQDFFARHGYITIHPDYRGYASSTSYLFSEHDFYVGYSEDVINLLVALKKLKSGLLDLNRIGMWGHSMGGGIATRIMVLRPEVRAYVLFAPISADVTDNFYELSDPQIKYLSEKYGEDSKAQPVFKNISPINYFQNVSSPVQLHHGTYDQAVPISFSEKIYQILQQYGKKAELYTYPGEGHEFIEDWPIAAERALQFFDKYVKKEY